MDFQIAFDLTTHPELIQPAYAFYALFLVFGLVLLAVALFLIRRRSRRRQRMLAFALIWLGFTTFMSFKDFEDTWGMREMVDRGAYTTVEGCLDYFHPGSPERTKGAGHERWSVGGTAFDYGRSEISSFYHLVEPRGGAVHRRSRLRISFVTSPYTGRREIVRLAVARDACPPAPDIDSN